MILGDNLFAAGELLNETEKESKSRFHEKNDELIMQVRKNVDLTAQYRSALEKHLLEDEAYQELLRRYNLLKRAIDKIKDYWDDSVEDFINTKIEIDK